MPGQDPTQQFVDEQLTRDLTADLTGSGSASAADAAERAAKPVDGISEYLDKAESIMTRLEHDRRNVQLADAFKEKTRQKTKREVLRKAIEHTINCESIDNMANTPDFIIAEFLDHVLGAVLSFNERREQWYATGLRIGGPIKLTPLDPEDCAHRHVILSEGPHCECYDCKSVMEYDPESRNWKASAPVPIAPPIQIDPPTEAVPPDPQPAGDYRFTSEVPMPAPLMPPPLAGTILDPAMYTEGNRISLDGISCPHCGWQPEHVALPTGLPDGIPDGAPVQCPNCRELNQWEKWKRNADRIGLPKTLAMLYAGVHPPNKMDDATAAAFHTVGDQFATMVFEALGEMSMQWDPRPAGVFQSTEALEIGRRIVREAAKLIINGRPAGDEGRPL